MTKPATGTHLDRATAYLERTGFSKTETAVLELPGDASDRHYVRVRSSDGSSFILLIHQDSIDSDVLPFFDAARVLTRMSIPTPVIRDHADDLGILVLDDLGDTTLFKRLDTATYEQRYTLYTEAVDLIAQMQRRGQEIASPEYLPFMSSFDEEKFSSELNFFIDHYLVSYRHAYLTALDCAALDEEFHSLARELAAEPRVFCHRDYHSRNLMLHDGRLYVIDFQDARMGPDTYDLVSLLRDCYVDNEPSFVSRMISRYHEQMGSLANSSYCERFDLMSVQRHLKALGTFGYQTAVIGKSGYVAAIQRTLGYLAGVFQRHTRFDRLRTLLTAHVPSLG